MSIRTALAIVSGLLLLSLPPAAHAAEPRAAAPAADLSRLRVSENDDIAVQELHRWLTARGMEASVNGGTVVYRRGLLLNITPLSGEGGVDRLMFRAYYNPADEFRDKPEFTALVAKANAAQNLLQVFVDGDGDVAIGSSLTFVDEFSAKEFDAFADLFVEVVKSYVLTDELVDMLK
jgi:hypothetical protein